MKENENATREEDKNGVALMLVDNFCYQNDGRVSCNRNHPVFYVIQSVIYQITPNLAASVINRI
jgi:hypothetical protein